MKFNRNLLLFLFVLGSLRTYATHINGGQIQYKQLTATTFEFTVIGYRSVDGILFQEGLLDFGDGTTFGSEEEEVIPWVRMEPQNGVEQWEFRLRHTYAGNGNYTVSYTGEFRTEGVQNIVGSVSTPFYVEAVLAVDPLIGTNSSPVFNYPDFNGVIGQRYMTSFSMIDSDGDSLSYRLVKPMQGAGTVVSHLELDDPSLYSGTPGLVEFSLTSGNLTWETENLSAVPPGSSLPYNITVKVIQWRDDLIVGENTIDYSVEMWNLTEEEGFEPVTFEFPACYDLNEPVVTEEITVVNPAGIGLNIGFSSDDDAFLIDGQTLESWNELMLDSVITNEDFSIPITYTNSFEGGIDKLRMEITSSIFIESLEVGLDVSQSRTLSFGTRCESDALSTPEFGQSIIRIAKDGITLLPSASFKKATISDLFGRELLTVDVATNSTIKYNFERNTVYLLTLVSDQELVTNRFLIR